MLNLPPQLLELDMSANLTQECCGRRHHLLREFQPPKLSLRRLIFASLPSCFEADMFLPLLKQCPDMEALQIPLLTCDSRPEYSAVELARVLETHCGRFQTLMARHCAPSCMHGMDLIQLVRAFSKGFQRLDLRMNRCYNVQSKGLMFLKWCPWLQELRIDSSKAHYRKGIDILDIINSMDEPWECWNRLEVLKLDVNNKGNTAKEAVHYIYQLFLKLRSLPQLRSLTLQWDFRTPNATLNMLNRVAGKEGSTLMTEEDMKWMGLPRQSVYH
ncbi:hypothetical protein B0O80DRAFT_451965 [Mortierella sp. GBAus27b]|nr:hypothetical protein B0O80DRAFT_451965 [Mortierella sp. GBAus27b]